MVGFGQMTATIKPLITPKSKDQKRYSYLITSRNKKLIPVVESFYNREMTPVLKYIADAELEDPIKISLRKSLIISCVSLVENILSILAVRVIEQNNLPIASLLDVPDETQANNRMNKFGKKRRIILSKAICSFESQLC
jgi:hypothetical protein